jgi:tetratricopeptide (TPR) repeat protein
MHMRCGFTIFLFIGMIAASAASGQGQTRPDNHSINRNWPDDGAQQPSPTNPSWEGQDAVALQFWEKTPREGNLVPVKLLQLSGPALKEMRKSDKALRAGDVRGSAEHLENMLMYGPDLAVVHNALGTRYVVLQTYDQGIEEFQKAAALDPKYRLAVDNIAVTMCMQHRYAEAEQAARWALQIQPEAATSRYLLGSILVEEGKITAEAARLLESVREDYPRARLFLAMIMVAKGDHAQAAEELRQYLSSPRAADNGVAKRWLGTLDKELNAQKQAQPPANLR